MSRLLTKENLFMGACWGFAFAKLGFLGERQVCFRDTQFSQYKNVEAHRGLFYSSVTAICHGKNYSYPVRRWDFRPLTVYHDKNETRNDSNIVK